MKKIFRRILNRFGYDLIYLKSRDGSVDDFPFHFKRNLSELKCDLIIDIGANKGQFGKWLFDKVNFEGSLLSFEPLQQMHEQLSLVAKEYKNWKVYDRVALGAEEGEITIDVSNLVGNSSVLGMKNTKYNVQNAHCVAQELVPQITLETLNTNEWMKSFKNAFIKIDVQGYELSVIRKLANAKYNVIGFYIELSLITLYENQEDYLEIAGFLKSMNYHLCYVEPESVRHNKMVQFNGLFLKGK